LKVPILKGMINTIAGYTLKIGCRCASAAATNKLRPGMLWVSKDYLVVDLFDTQSKLNRYLFVHLHPIFRCSMLQVFVDSGKIGSIGQSGC
jgi:hypothetical protein